MIIAFDRYIDRSAIHVTTIYATTLPAVALLTLHQSPCVELVMKKQPKKEKKVQDTEEELRCSFFELLDESFGMFTCRPVDVAKCFHIIDNHFHEIKTILADANISTSCPFNIPHFMHWRLSERMYMKLLVSSMICLVFIQISDCLTILHTPLTTSLFLGLNQLDYTLNVFGTTSRVATKEGDFFSWLKKQQIKEAWDKNFYKPINNQEIKEKPAILLSVNHFFYLMLC
ncbi:hypothetical protein ACJX0J_038196 [Zea mays]